MTSNHQSSMIVTVASVQTEAEGIRSFRLIRSDDRPMPAFKPGDHIDVHIGPGLIRQYSLCNGPEERDYFHIAVKREAAGRGGSTAMHDTVMPGSRLVVSEPKSNFPLHSGAGFFLLIAGGIGITPILSMARHLATAGADFALHYCAATPTRAAFLPFLERSGFHERVHLHFDDGKGGTVVDLDRLLAMSSPDTHLYMCGPSGLMDAVRMRTASSWPTGSVHWEYFGAAPPTDLTALADGETAFTVELARCGRSVMVPAGVSIVTALAEAGVPVEVSCEQGVCGTCLTRVISGEPEHRDLILSDEERATNNQMALCVSRARTPTLLLDL